MTRLLRVAAIGIVALAILFLQILGTRAEGTEKTVDLRLQSFALSLHPLKMADVESRQVATLLYTGLVFQDQEGNTHPALASSWSHSGNEWEFILRPGVTFSNGLSVQPDDVVASLCAAMQPTSPWAWALASIGHETDPDGKTIKCTGLAVLPNGRVKVTEQKPVPWLLDAISGPAGWILPASAAKEGAYGVMPGTGPYKVREIVPDVKVVLEARREGSPVTPGADVIQFNYLPDDTVAARQFATGKLDVLDLTSPQLVDLVTEPGSRKLKYRGTLIEKTWDRIRVVIVNKKALTAKGFEDPKVRQFIDAFSASVARDRIAKVSHGIGEPADVPFLPAPLVPPKRAKVTKTPEFPEVRLSIITEPDPYSDLIAASLPKQVGNVSLDYKGVEKGILIDSLVKGKYDLASLLIEATAHSPEFWKSFFTPGSPLSLFGTPIAGLEKVDVATESGIATAVRRITTHGNWVAVLRERRIQAVAPSVSDIMFTPSGQTNFAFIQKR